MSRQSIVLLVAILLAIGGGVYWYLSRPTRPGELDIRVQNLPDLPPVQIAAGDWPWWRGPARDNHSPDAEAPTSWSETKNVVWKTAIAGRGHSSPILFGNRIFLTSADETAQRQFVLCLDRGTGDKLWETTVLEKSFPPKHGHSSWASGTPACDGERVFAVFPNGGGTHVAALSVDKGDLLWLKEAGPHGGEGSHGYGGSLAIWGKFVYVCDDSPKKGWIAALHRQSGEFGWRQGRKTGTGSYGSPIVADLSGKPTLLIGGNGKITAYDPAKGELFWERDGLGEVSANTVAFGGDMVFGSSGFSKRALLAVKADGSEAWKKTGSLAPYPPSMLWRDGFLYVISDEGLATCLKADTGEEKWKERISHGYASPLSVGNNIYQCGSDGTTTIFEASPDGFTEVAKNKLDAGINASPVAVGGKLYIRTDTHLYCIGQN